MADVWQVEKGTTFSGVISETGYFVSVSAYWVEMPRALTWAQVSSHRHIPFGTNVAAGLAFVMLIMIARCTSATAIRGLWKVYHSQVSAEYMAWSQVLGAQGFLSLLFIG